MSWWSMLPVTGVPILVGFAYGNYACMLEQLPLEEAVDHVMVDLHAMLGNHIVTPTHALVTHWNSDPWAHGAYSHIPPGSQMSDYNIVAHPVYERLFFAGEATSTTYPSTVHGALLSGEREALRILEVRNHMRPLAQRELRVG